MVLNVGIWFVCVFAKCCVAVFALLSCATISPAAFFLLYGVGVQSDLNALMPAQFSRTSNSCLAMLSVCLLLSLLGPLLIFLFKCVNCRAIHVKPCFLFFVI